jgi:hypothetical protein
VSKSLFTYPTEIPKSAMNDYVMVSKYNHAEMIKLGRIYYVIDTTFHKPHLMGVYCIYPCLRPNSTLVVKGDHSTPRANYEVFCKDGQKYDDWKDGYDSVIKMYENSGMLYVKKGEKLVKFEFR